MNPKIATLSELMSMPSQENGEPLVELSQFSEGIKTSYRRKQSGVNEVWVRKSVAERLERVQFQLAQKDSSMQLLVVEGYRSFGYQERYFFEEFLKIIRVNPTVNLDFLLETTHKFVAVPSVAGHPTGGAVDITIVQNGKELDMGGAIADFERPELLPTSSLHVSEKQRSHRMLLHDLMLSEGFAPFYGEWWHFSYGDKEWAVFYNQPKAYYSVLL